MKKFVKTNLIIYISFLILCMISDFIVVKFNIENILFKNGNEYIYLFGTIFYILFFVALYVSYCLNKNIFSHVNSKYKKYTYITLLYLFTILLLWFFGLIILVNFHFLIGGSH